VRVNDLEQTRIDTIIPASRAYRCSQIFDSLVQIVRIEELLSNNSGNRFEKLILTFLQRRLRNEEKEQNESM